MKKFVPFLEKVRPFFGTLFFPLARGTAPRGPPFCPGAVNRLGIGCPVAGLRLAGFTRRRYRGLGAVGIGRRRASPSRSIRRRYRGLAANTPPVAFGAFGRPPWGRPSARNARGARPLDTKETTQALLSVAPEFCGAFFDNSGLGNSKTNA